MYKQSPVRNMFRDANPNRVGPFVRASQSRLPTKVVRGRGKLFAFVTFPVLLSPFLAHAATVSELLEDFTILFGDIVLLLIGIAVVVFFWGLIKFVAHAGDEKTLDEGKQIMIWGLVALFVMVSLWAVIGFFQSELGLKSAPPPGALPQQPTSLP